MTDTKQTTAGARHKQGFPILVIGGGASGQRATADLLAAGHSVLLVEKSDTLGGTMAQLGTMFPQHNCLLCRGDFSHGNGCTRPAISNDLLDHTQTEALTVLTRSVVEKIEKKAEGFSAVLRIRPRYVDPGRCILCDRCSRVCPKELPDPFQAGLAKRKAAYRPAERCVPDAYALEKGEYCEGCGKCVEACPTDAINLAEDEHVKTIPLSAVVLAAGMNLYDPVGNNEYGFGKYANIITGLQMERMTSPAGPGEGKIMKPSDGSEPSRMAWIQCVGSRDEEHDYCSSFCCGYATKQAVLAKQFLPSADARIFMMDDRVFGREFIRTYDPLRRDYGIKLEHCRVSVVTEDPATKDIVIQVQAEDGTMREERFGLVVLSVGATAAAGLQNPTALGGLSLKQDKYGFLRTDTLSPVDTGMEGVFVVGNLTGPADIADSATQGSAAAARVCAYLSAPDVAGENGGPLQTAVPGDENGGGRSKPPGKDGRLFASKSGEAVRAGIFVCDCAGEIGNAMPLHEILGSLSRIPGVQTAETVSFGCLPEGLKNIRGKIEKNDLTAVLMGACKRRTYGPLFENSLPVPVKFVSLREECSYVHESDREGTTNKARDLLNFGLLRLFKESEQEEEPSVKIGPMPKVLVHGGGLAGLTSSLHLASLGIHVDLVEKEDILGGNALRLNKTPEGRDVPAFITSMIRETEKNPLIDVHLKTEAAWQSSSKGRFQAVLRGHGNDISLETGAVIIATGGREYRGKAYGLGESEGVTTLLSFGEKIKANPGLPGELNQIVFIGCVGPWDEAGSGASWRCSRNCCETMIRQAKAVKEGNPDCQVAVAVREVNTYAFREEDYTAARNAGVLFVRFDPAYPPRYSETNGKPELLVPDMSLGQTLEFNPDLVVLSAAVLPGADAEKLSAAIEIPLSGDGFFKEWESKTGPCKTLEPGVFLCGLAHGPKPVREVIIQSLAAAQYAAVFADGTRIFYPEKTAKVNEGKCAGCFTCVRSCPYLVPRIGKQGKAAIAVTRCQGCGTCVSECPAGAISLDRFDPTRIMTVPPELGNGTFALRTQTSKPRITVVSCKYCGNVPVEMAGIKRNQYPASVRVVDVPCTGLVTAEFVMKTLELEAEGMVILACPEGTCHHLTGNKRAKKRVQYVGSIAGEAGVDPKRLRFLNLGIGMGETFARLMREMAAELDETAVGG